MALTLNGTTGISGIAGSAGTPALQGNNDANTGYFFAADTLGLSTAGSERLRIDSNGSLLIGAISSSGATEKLRIENDSATSDVCQVTIISGNAERAILNFGDAQDHNIGRVTYDNNANSLFFHTDNTERLRITGDGPHLLLGGTADVNEITESASNTGMVIGSTSVGNGGIAIINSTSGTGRIYFGDATGNNAARNRGQINYYHNGDYMMLATAGAERLRIDSSGNVGIGGSPTNNLHLGASGADQIRSMKIDGTNGSSELQGFIIENDGANSKVNLKLGTGGGTPATKLTLLPAGGMTFNGDTAAANALDDYEEGTWTPTDGSGASLTFTSVNAWYVKVGDLVTMGARFAYPTTTNTNQNKIGGFPFSPGTNVFSVGGLMVGTVQNPMGNQGSWSGMDQTGRLRTENASIPYNDDLSGQTVYLSYSYKTD